MTQTLQNRLTLIATVKSEAAVRYTPAGIPVIETWLTHVSTQTEAKIEREARFEIQAVLIGEQYLPLAGKLLGQTLSVSGFLTQRSLRNSRLVLHIESAKFVKG